MAMLKVIQNKLASNNSGAHGMLSVESPELTLTMASSSAPRRAPILASCPEETGSSNSSGNNSSMTGPAWPGEAVHECCCCWLHVCYYF